MDDVVLVAVVDGAGDLPGKLSGDALAEAAVADDVVEHLAAVDILEDHVVVVLVDDHLAHAADVRVVEEHGEGGLSEGTGLLGGVLCGLLRGGVREGGMEGGVDAGEDFDGKLGGVRETAGTRGRDRPFRRRRCVLRA